MFILARLITYLAPIIIFLDYQLVFLRPRLIYCSLGIALLIILFSIWVFSGRKINKEFIHFLIAPLLFIASGFLFFLFLETKIFQQILIFAISFMIYLFLENIFNYALKPESYQPYALESISNYMNLITAFIAFSSFFALIIFLAFPTFLLVAGSAAISFLLGYQTIWMNKIDFKKSLLYLAVFSLIMAELFWSIHYLPTGFLVNGLIMTTLFYALSGLIRFHLLKALNRMIIFRYLIISSIVILFSLVTAQWI